MTRRKAILAIPGSAALAALAVQTGCSGDQIITDLQAALDLISGFLPQLASITGVPAALLAAVETYIASTNTALGNASTILLGAGSAGEKTALILAAFAGIAAPLIPPPFNVIAGIVAGLAAAVAKFIAGLPPATPAGPKVALAAGQSWSTRQREKIAHATASASANSLALAKLPRK